MDAPETGTLRLPKKFLHWLKVEAAKAGMTMADLILTFAERGRKQFGPQEPARPWEVPEKPEKRRSKAS